jgi:ABC-type nickel/cobalt efflux system permease component RcnA
MDEQPVLSQAAIVAAVSAVLIALVSLGVLNLDDAQMEAIVKAVAAVLVIAAPLVGGWWARNRTTPTAKPVDSDGVTPLVRADNQQPGVRAKAAGREVVRTIEPTPRGAGGPRHVEAVRWSK